MNKILKAVFFLAISAGVTLLASKNVLADGDCVPVYGGGVQCPRVGQVLIDKTVRNPSTGVFVDNLGLSDPKYRPASFVTFRLTVKNSGDQALEKVIVVDKIPQFVDFMTGPGTYDAKNKTLTFEVKNLDGGSSQVFEITGRVVHQAVLPEAKNVVCITNVVDAKADSQTDRDESQFCIEKRMEVPTVPKAGPEDWLLILTGLSTVLTSGLYLRRKSFGIQ